MEKSTHTKLYDALRARLILMRKEANLTQRQLAERLGREHSFVGRMEIGDRRLDIVELYWICVALGVTPENVFNDVLKDFQAISKRARLIQPKQ